MRDPRESRLWGVGVDFRGRARLQPYAASLGDAHNHCPMRLEGDECSTLDHCIHYHSHSLCCWGAPRTPCNPIKYTCKCTLLHHDETHSPQVPPQILCLNNLQSLSQTRPSTPANRPLHNNCSLHMRLHPLLRLTLRPSNSRSSTVPPHTNTQTSSPEK